MVSTLFYANEPKHDNERETQNFLVDIFLFSVYW